VRGRRGSHSSSLTSEAYEGDNGGVEEMSLTQSLFNDVVAISKNLRNVTFKGFQNEQAREGNLRKNEGDRKME